MRPACSLVSDKWPAIANTFVIPGIDEATSVARSLQWGVENDITFNHTLHTGADPESFGGVHVILN